MKPSLTLLVALALAAGPATAQLDRPDPTLSTVAWRDVQAVADRLLVAFEPGTPGGIQAARHATVGAVVLRQLRADAALVALPGGSDLDTYVEAYADLPDVELAEPDVIHTAVATPDDPSLALQWSLSVIGATAAWDDHRGHPGTVIAVIDTGVDTDHPDLLAHDQGGHDHFAGDAVPEDTHGHGTHCAGLAAAVTDNGLGVAGAGHDCSFRAYRAGDGSFPTSTLVLCIQDAVGRGDHVLSMSWGSSYNSYLLRTALGDAHDAGCVLVAAAGNDGVTAPFYPAALDDVLGVGASTPLDARASFSNHGSWVSLTAPGQSLYSTDLHGGYGYRSGTSMAAPLVSGAAGLLYAALGGERSPAARDRVEAALLDTAVPVGSWVARGRLDLDAALERLGSERLPVLSGLAPTTAAAFAGDQVLLFGAGLLGLDGITVDGTPATEVTLLDDETLRFTLPEALALGTALVTVEEQGAPSNALPLLRVATDPPRLAAPDQRDPGEELAWRYGGRPDDLALLLISPAGSTLPFRGSALLSPFFVIHGETLGPVGLGGLTVLVPASLDGITVHAQIATLDGGLVGLSPVVETLLGS